MGWDAVSLSQNSLTTTSPDSWLGGGGPDFLAGGLAAQLPHPLSIHITSSLLASTTPAADLAAKGGGIFCRFDATCLSLCPLLLVQVASAAGARAQRSLSARVHASTSTTVEQKPAAPAAAPNGGGGGGTRVMIIGACVGGERDRVCQCNSVIVRLHVNLCANSIDAVSGSSK